MASVFISRGDNTLTMPSLVDSTAFATDEYRSTPAMINA